MSRFPHLRVIAPTTWVIFVGQCSAPYGVRSRKTLSTATASGITRVGKCDSLPVELGECEVRQNRSRGTNRRTTQSRCLDRRATCEFRSSSPCFFQIALHFGGAVGHLFEDLLRESVTTTLKEPRDVRHHPTDIVSVAVCDSAFVMLAEGCDPGKMLHE